MFTSGGYSNSDTASERKSMKAVGRAARYGRRYQFLTKVRQSFRKQQQTVVMLARNRDKQPEFPISSDDPDKMPTHQSWQI